jgi:hypothetical protein
MTRRILRGLAAATLLVALSAGAVSAGGWATIQADPGNPPQPNAGEPFTFGFTVLQHGVTPAGWETPTFLGINGATGERVEVKAVAQGADGHFVATVTIPSGGFWTWQVMLTDLIVETAPQPMAVAFADGTLPAMDTGSMLSDLRTQVTQLSAEVAYLESQREALSKRVDGLAANPNAAAPASESVPLFAVVGIAVLAGAISGFAMTMLGRSTRKPEGSLTGAEEELAPASGTLTTR